MSQETSNRYFDELASGLASGSISRGRALRLIGAALVGGTLASLGIREAAADPPGCKRNGKHCKNDEQCCSRNCEGGKCAAACLSNGGTCTANDQCCSRRCAGGMCAEPCPAGTVLLCNGTCAKTCTSDADCTGCRFECATEAASVPPRSLCSNPTDSPTPCTTSCGCPSGQFCRRFPNGETLCVFAC
jgi:hypothetical protein